MLANLTAAGRKGFIIIAKADVMHLVVLHSTHVIIMSIRAVPFYCINYFVKMTTSAWLLQF